MIVERKPVKLPGQLLTRVNNLEYGINSLSIQINTLKKFNSFIVVDDLLASLGKVNFVARLLHHQRKKTIGLKNFC